MTVLRLIRWVVLVLALLLTVVGFVPLGVYMQWFVPTDYYICGVCVYGSIGVLILTVAWLLWRRARAGARTRWWLQAGAVCLFTLAVLWTTVTCIPFVGWRVGPWAELRQILVHKSEEVVAARSALSIPADRGLTAEEMDAIEDMVFDPAPAYTFPIIERTVHVRLMSRKPPYAGIDFGGGRRAVFDLVTMRIIYAD